MNRLMYVWFAVKTVFCNCQSDHKVNGFQKVGGQYKSSKIATLPAVISESSGVVRAQADNVFWSHNDSGGKSEIYAFSLNGKLISTKNIPGAKNTDWEDMARDDQGNLYIGDFGNNGVARNAFEIYRYNPESGDTGKITFTYAKTPARQGTRPVNDCEAFFWYQDSLYLFSKAWNSNELTKLYKIPAKDGNYQITATDSIAIDSQVTAADISPDGKKFALLTYGKVLVFSVGPAGIDFSKPVGCFKLKRKQTEALTFLNNTDMLITNEQGEAYRITYR